MKKTYRIVMLSGLLICSALATCLAQKSNDEPKNQWPMKIEAKKGTVTIYQPQLDSFENDKMTSRAAVSVTPVGQTDPIFGAMFFTCRVSTDLDDRTVTLVSLKVTEAKFPDGDQAKIDSLSRFLEEELPRHILTFSLDDLLSDMQTIEEQKKISENLNTQPPEIIFVPYAAALILIDGNPKLVDVQNTSYQYVMNTPFFIVFDKTGKKYYLKGGNYWYSASDIKGEWKNITTPPKEVQKLAEEAMKQEDQSKQEQSSDKTKSTAATNETTVIPKIIIRTKPAELLQSAGEPNFVSITGTSLLFMTNTDSYIFMDIGSQKYYVLISGRWYTGPSLEKGPWEFIAPDKLPGDFAKIPKDSEVSDVLASVAGTEEAEEALLQNQVPQTATINRKEAKLEVKYDGTPKFEAIGTTGMKYAVNTDKSVLLIDGKYYCCDNAVWFESKSPTGPWTVSVKVPDKVQEIPPDNPTYNVKYVYIYDSTPEVVYIGYTPGYTYCYVYGPTVVYGTGYYYYPWYGVYYYPRPVTYGFCVRWNPYMGWSFGFGMSWGGPVGWFSFGWHSPYYGWWGPAGYRHGYYHGYNQGYHHGYVDGYRAGHDAGNRPAASTNVNNNIYRNRSNGVQTTGGERYNPKTGESRGQLAQNNPRTTSPSTMDKAKPANTPTTSDRSKNNVYTDKQGNVYKKEGDSWQQRENGQWKDAGSTKDASKNNINNLDKDSQSRERSAQKTQNYNNNRQSYQPQRPAGSYNRTTSSSVSRGGGGGRR